jgi:carbon-monoxide dehydrogenase small subunit
VWTLKKVDIKIRVNGDWYELEVNPGDRLIDVLRDRLELTGTKEGCGEGECGACTVNLDGQAVLSCLILAAQADGCTVLTVEGLRVESELHPLQKAFVSESAVQCGYCTPGMIMAANALINSEAEPTENSIRKHLSNNMCRCTGYDRPVKAILKAAQDMKGDIHV